jgi:hypothetical protein
MKELMSADSTPTLYSRMGEKLQRAWVKVLQWDTEKARIRLNRLARRNRDSRKTVLAPHGPVVSLTTYGKRIQTVYLTLESIAAGSVLPSRLILWLDDEAAWHDPPASLQRLKDRGLEILLSANYGPHTKYYPYLESTAHFDIPLVTADDDTIYPHSWLKGLMQSYAANPQVVSCYRAHEMKFAGNILEPYVSWGRCRSDKPAYRYLNTGVSGCLYPPEFLTRLKAAGKGFEQVCPKADDIWLHVNAIRAGYKIRQILPWQMTYPMLPDTQDMGLAVSNVHAAQNDTQVRSTYTASDLDLLRSEIGGLSPK